jgi:glycosyltransferase involved in cell wall biosynthesis
VLYAPTDAEDLAQKLQKVLSDPAFREEIAQNGQNHLREHCREPIMAVEIEDFFNKIAK